LSDSDQLNVSSDSLKSNTIGNEYVESEDDYADIDTVIKEEPVDLHGHGADFLNVDENQIVLNFDETDLVAKVKEEPPDEDGDSGQDNYKSPKLTIAPWPAFVTLGSHPELASAGSKGGAKKREGTPVLSEVRSEAGGEGPSPKKGKTGGLEDVTEQYLDLSEEEQVMCGICGSWDPPSNSSITTQWVGCDCDRWFHKCCTKLKRVTDKFSCRSVKMKCQQ